MGFIFSKQIRMCNACLSTTNITFYNQLLIPCKISIRLNSLLTENFGIKTYCAICNFVLCKKCIHNMYFMINTMSTSISFCSKKCIKTFVNKSYIFGSNTLKSKFYKNKIGVQNNVYFKVQYLPINHIVFIL